MLPGSCSCANRKLHQSFHFYFQRLRQGQRAISYELNKQIARYVLHANNESFQRYLSDEELTLKTSALYGGQYLRYQLG